MNGQPPPGSQPYQPPQQPYYPPPQQWPPPQQGYMPGMEAHRGGAVLALGILGLVICVICGIIAWVMGSEDLKKMQAGTMDPSGYGNTRAGQICGIISVALAGLMLVIMFIALAVGAASF